MYRFLLLARECIQIFVQFVGFGVWTSSRSNWKRSAKWVQRGGHLRPLTESFIRCSLCSLGYLRWAWSTWSTKLSFALSRARTETKWETYLLDLSGKPRALPPNFLFGWTLLECQRTRSDQAVHRTDRRRSSRRICNAASLLYLVHNRDLSEHDHRGNRNLDNSASMARTNNQWTARRRKRDRTVNTTGLLY